MSDSTWYLRYDDVDYLERKILSELPFWQEGTYMRRALLDAREALIELEQAIDSLVEDGYEDWEYGDQQYHQLKDDGEL